MTYFYLVCFILAFILFVWQILSDERRSVTQHVMLLVLVIANGGYFAFMQASNLQEAVLAQKIIYIGGCFLPMLYFITVCEICHKRIPRGIISFLFVIQGALYAAVCTIGKNNWYYKDVVFHIKNGNSFLTKQYGPLHIFYLITMYVYLLLALWVVLTALYKKTSMSTKGIVIMMVSFFLAVAAYIGQRALGLEYEVMPIVYIILFFGSCIQSYRSNLYTIEENKNIVEEIPIEARIMALADVFDALVSKRCYKEAFSFDKAFSIIEHDAGSHFDAALAEIFLRCRPQLEAYYRK